MDWNFINKKNVIERYLLGQLSENELAQFNLALMRDKALQQEVQAQRMLFKTLWKNNSAGKAVSSKPQSFTWKWLGGLLLILGVCGLVYWLMPANDGINNEPTENVISPIDSIEEEIQDSIIPQEKEEKEVTPIQKKDNPPVLKKKPQPKKPQKTTAPKEKVERPIAANFEVNSDLEIYITGKRGNSLTLNSPKQIDSFLLGENGFFEFILDGFLERDDNEYLDEKTYLYLFSNKKEDYSGFKPLVTEELLLEFKAAENHYEFQWTQPLELVPGLYYYLIEGERSGLYIVGKFVVK